MPHEQKPQPLNTWLKRTKTSTSELSTRVEEHGHHASPKYLEHIANGLMEPGWALCFVLEEICGIDARELKHWGYRNSKPTKHAA